MSPVSVLLSRAPVTVRGSSWPSTSTSSLFHTNSIFGLANRRSCRIFSARRLLAPVHERHARGDVGEIERLLDGSVAAADHDHVLAAEEEAVAGGAGRHAIALEALLGGQAEPAGLRAGGDDKGVGGVFGAAVALEPEGLALEIDRFDMVGDDLGALIACTRIWSMSQGPWITSAKPG